MYRSICAVLMVAGIVLAFWGMRASESFDSDVSRFFTGSPTDKAMWLIIGGIVLGGVGLLGLIFGRKGS